MVHGTRAPAVPLIKTGGTFIMVAVIRIVTEVIAGEAIVHTDLALRLVDRMAPGVGALELQAVSQSLLRGDLERAIPRIAPGCFRYSSARRR